MIPVYCHGLPFLRLIGLTLLEVPPRGSVDDHLQKEREMKGNIKNIKNRKIVFFAQFVHVLPTE